jgi:hypothetical protein
VIFVEGESFDVMEKTPAGNVGMETLTAITIQQLTPQNVFRGKPERGLSL